MTSLSPSDDTHDRAESRQSAPSHDEARFPAQGRDIAVGDAPVEAPGAAHDEQYDRHATDLTRNNAALDPSRTSAPDDAAAPQAAPKHDDTRNDTLQRDDARNDAPEHATARLSAQEHAGTRHDVIADEVRPATTATTAETPRPEALPEWLDIEETAAYLQKRGIRRAIRTIQHSCKTGRLLSKLVPTENGTRYLVEKTSIDAYVTRHNQMMPIGVKAEDHGVRRADPNDDPVSEPVTASPVSTPNLAASPAHPVAEHYHEILTLKDEQIGLLKDQLGKANEQMAVKDEQIMTMHERDHETNVLIQNLQNLMGLPAGANPTASVTKTIDTSQSPDHDWRNAA